MHQMMNITFWYHFFMPLSTRLDTWQDSWAGAVVHKPPRIQECEGPTKGPTNQPIDTARWTPMAATKNEFSSVLRL